MSLFICQRCEAQHEKWDGACPACGGTELLTVAPAVDRMLGRVVASRFRILRRLGQGGMGSVYLAEQVGIGQQVAMKFLNSGLSMDPDVARRFLNEAKSYARVAHPNAVTLHDFGQDEEGSLYISMEYVEGDDLKSLLAACGRLALDEAVDIVLQVADVLAYAHARQVIHRDLKPENIMVRQGMRGWHVKVLDFGIARITDGATRLTVQGAVAGTPRYMSPEQAMGLDVDARADVYAVGIVLFELLTGQQPFDGNSVSEIMQKQVHQPMPRLAQVAADLQYPTVDAVIQKATAKRREERYATMEAFASDLVNALPTLTSRRAVSGINPAITGGGLEPARPATLLFGTEGSEATLVRAAPAEAAPVTGSAPIPLTQPAAPSGLRVGSEGFNKTAHAASPYAAPKRSKSSAVVGLGIAGVLLLGGVGLVALRGGSRDDVKEGTLVPVGSPAQPASPVAPPAKEAGASPHATSGTVETAPDDVATRQLKVLAAGQAIDIGNDFNEGRLDSAMKRLAQARSLGLDAVEPELAALAGKVEDASKRMARARALENDGNCETAITLYRALKRDHPQLVEAQRGIRRCQDMLPPEVSD
ncbi:MULTISPECIES: serine/threonine protein kinase [Myxococcus]|nr:MULTISPECIES: protein kinase [Myxococcus]NOJ52617.1 protein kinase [Myxococcus xanthus]QPM77154.1 protein kinase [Myxococcus xanthus]QVW66223.1 protein kinase [Myxococcus xanthus DZ2]QZZ52269.1 Serine/threonine-protein kinase PknD [Myxococcus xanthus]UEO07650.1 protein kinase [Myxococcus xanthus DZ2]